MARPPLALESWGKIRRTYSAEGTPTAVAYYRDLDGKRRRITRTGKTLANAEARLKAALQERLTPAASYLSQNSTLNELSEAWLSDIDRQDLSPSTRSRYRSVISSRLVHFGEMRIIEATVPRLQRIIDLVAAEKPSQARMLGFTLSGMLDLAVRQGAARANNAKSLRLPSQGRKEVKVPSANELTELFSLLREYDSQTTAREESIRNLHSIALMMIATGARIGEVLALRWDDFNFESWTVTIQSTLVRDPKKGLVRRPPKTKSSIRTLVLPKFIRPWIAEAHLSSMVSWVFPSATGAPRWPENIRAQWNEAIKGSDVSWIRPHALRKTVATALGSESAKEQLGHATITVTDKHYIEKSTLREDHSAILEQFASLS